MSDSDHPAPEDADRRETAARWTVRRDRGLSAAESIEYELWLAADSRHAQAMQRSGGAWSILDRIPDNVAQQALAEATRRRSFWRRGLVAGSLAAAAALALVIQGSWQAIPEPPDARFPTSLQAAGPSTVTLADGSTVRLNTGSELVEQFTGTERRVLLARGEANFEVTSDAARPFIVRAGNIDVRAVGTAFNVNLQSAAVEVLVTEGVVKVDPSPGRPSDATTDTTPLLVPGQRAVVALAPVAPTAAVVVTLVNTEEMARALAWQEPLLRLGGATLAEVAAGFERRTGRRVILADPALAGLRLGGRFRADDIDGFANLLATTLEIDVERAADGALVLRKKTAGTR